MSVPALAVAGLAKTVPGGRTLCSGLSLALAPGELVAITGESGAGKSTLLNLFAGLDEPDAGTIAIAGVPLGPLDERGRAALRRTRIGFVFQAFHILPHLTLTQNVALPAVLAKDRQAEAQAGALLDAMGLGGRGADYPAALSGGELQRVAIARALVNSPPLLLADEPTGNLDTGTAARVLDLFVARVREAGAAAVIVTHSERAAAHADRVLRLTDAGLA